MISTPDTNNDSSTDSNEQVAGLTSNFEVSNYRGIGEITGNAAMSMHALLGTGLTRPDGTHINRLTLSDPDALASMSARNISQRRGGILGVNRRPGYITQIVDQLYAHIRNPASRRRITTLITRRYNEIFKERQTQMGTAPNLAADNILRSECLMEAIAEQVNDVDLPAIAANIAANIGADGNLTPIERDTLRAHYANASAVVPATVPPTYEYEGLTDEGMKLLNRLRGEDGVASSRVLLAFAASLDTEHFNPQAAGLPAIGSPTVSGRDRLDLMTDVLDAPEAGMTEDIYLALQKVSLAVEAYEKIEEDDVLFTDVTPPVALSGSPTIKETADYNAKLQVYNKMHAKYLKAFNRSDTLRSSIVYLEEELAAIATAGSYADVPAELQSYIDTSSPYAGRVSSLITPTGPPPRGKPISIPNTVSSRNIITSGGRSISKPKEYQILIDNIDNNQGLTGANAVDAVLGNYIPRVSGVGIKVSKLALEHGRSSAKAADPKMRYEREKQSRVPDDPIEKQWDTTDAVLEQNRDAESWGRKWIGKPVAIVFNRIPKEVYYFGRHELLDMRHPVDIFRANLLDQLGVEVSARDRVALNPSKQLAQIRNLDNTNDLDALTTRYFTFWHLVQQNDPRIVQTNNLTQSLRNLRAKIVKLQLENITRTLSDKGIDGLSEEEVKATGLNSTNFESIDYAALQAKMGAYLDSKTTEPGTMSKIQPIIDRAQYQIDFRKRRTETHRTWRKKWLWSLDTGALNPAQYVNNFAIQPLKSLVTGKSKHTNVDKVLGKPSRIVQGTVKGLWKGITGAAKWLNTSSKK